MTLGDIIRAFRLEILKDPNKARLEVTEIILSYKDKSIKVLYKGDDK